MLLGIELDVVEFGLVVVRAAVAMRIMNVLPLIGSDAADVGSVGELLLVVIHAVLAIEQAVVAHENDEGTVEFATAFEFGQEFSHAPMTLL